MDAELINQLKAISMEERELLDGKTAINRNIYMKSNSSKIDSDLLLERGKLISLRPHTRFVHFPKHTHNYVEMVYMCKGQTRHRINGHDLLLKEGELLLLSQNAQQEILPADEDDIAVNFIILPQFFDTAIRMIGDERNPIRDFLIDCLKGESKFIDYLHFEVADVLPIQNLVENLIWTLVNHQINKRSINQSTMGLLFLQLANHTDTLKTDPEYAEGQLAFKVLRYIEDNYKDASLAEIADELHYDLCWLSREIKTQTGKNFTELLQAKRLNQASFLLKTTTLKITEISQSVGYENFSYFHRIFKAHYGMSPKKYRSCK